MLQPKKRKYSKAFRGTTKGRATRGTTVVYGDMGLQAVESGWIDGRQIEAARKAIVRHNKRKGRFWIRIFPDQPRTRKPAEVGMGKGKGAVDRYVAVVKPGRVLVEVGGGLDEESCRRSLELAAQKFPIKSKIIVKL